MIKNSDASASPALLATVARHLAKTERAAREAVLGAVLRLAHEPNAGTINAFAEEISAVRLNPGARRSVIGAVMNALPRSAPQNRRFGTASGDRAETPECSVDASTCNCN